MHADCFVRHFLLQLVLPSPVVGLIKPIFLFCWEWTCLPGSPQKNTIFNLKKTVEKKNSFAGKPGWV
jgi:hypothetical protein